MTELFAQTMAESTYHTKMAASSEYDERRSEK